MIRRPPRSTRTDTRFPYTTLFRSGLVHSQRVLLALTQAGVSREDSYRYVQRNAMKVWESDGQLSLMELLKADPDVAAALTAEQIEEKFNLDYHFREVDTIFRRVFGESDRTGPASRAGPAGSVVL